MDDSVCLTLSGDEALVLFEFLRRSDDENTIVVQDQAEERVLWTLEAQLAKSLGVIFDPRYGALLAAARDRVRDPAE